MKQLKIVLTEIVCDIVERIQPAHHRVQQQDLVDTAMNFQDP
jgi:hypothetical protein